MIKAVKHRIDLDTPGTRPVYSILYRAGPMAQKIYDIYMESMLDIDVIELSQTEWASPIYFVLKKRSNFDYACNIGI